MQQNIPFRRVFLALAAAGLLALPGLAQARVYWSVGVGVPVYDGAYGSPTPTLQYTRAWARPGRASSPAAASARKTRLNGMFCCMANLIAKTRRTQAEFRQHG